MTKIILANIVSIAGLCGSAVGSVYLLSSLLTGKLKPDVFLDNYKKGDYWIVFAAIPIAVIAGWTVHHFSVAAGMIPWAIALLGVILHRVGIKKDGTTPDRYSTAGWFFYLPVTICAVIIFTPDKGDVTWVQIALTAGSWYFIYALIRDTRAGIVYTQSKKL